MTSWSGKLRVCGRLFWGKGNGRSFDLCVSMHTHTHLSFMTRCSFSHCDTEAEHVCSAQKQPCSPGTQMRDSDPIVDFPVCVCVCV